MYQPMLYLHWKQIRWFLIPGVIASFGLPLVSVQGLGAPATMEGIVYGAPEIMRLPQVWLPFFPLLAGLIGVTLALSAWNWDHKLGHVYALSLPLSRSEYAMLKMGAGAMLLLVPSAAMWVGAHAASVSVTLPEGLHTYPNQVAARFLFAALIAYAAVFAMAAGTVKTTMWIVSGVLVFVIGGSVGLDIVAEVFGLDGLGRLEIVGDAVRWLTHTPGPFEVFTGNWSLIDV